MRTRIIARERAAQIIIKAKLKLYEKKYTSENIINVYHVLYTLS